MTKFIMSFDAGTTSNRVIIFNDRMEEVSSAKKELNQIFPKAGWVEHSPNEIFSAISGSALEAMIKAKIKAEDISAIGITNQRETTIVWDKRTGEPVHNAIVWQCRRTQDMATRLIEDGYEEFFRNKTGLKVDAYFSATKLKWILDNVEGAREEAEKGNLLFGTVDTWLLWKVTGGMVHATDYSNASRTMLYNIIDLDWDDEILNLLDIPRLMLPEVRSSSEVYGHTSRDIFGYEIPIAGIAGDQQSALYGQMCFDKGEIKNTYGTGAFLLMNTGDEPVFSKNGLVTTIAASLPDKVKYALEGSIFSAGSAVQWLRDGIRIIDSSDDTEYLATKVDSSEGVYVVPAFTGLGAPYWSQYSRAMILGITRATTKHHIVRATLESVAYLTEDLIEAMEEESGTRIKSLKVDGGMSQNDFVMGIQADILNSRVIRPDYIESTALGASLLAGLAVGVWKSEEEVKGVKVAFKTFEPKLAEETRIKMIKGWRRAVSACVNYMADEV
ncbi:MAG: glycerol kinase GlpK [Tissierellia bacterium]|nr:glycerol kinase GlpK [Tissierellia bacterium]